MKKSKAAAIFPPLDRDAAGEWISVKSATQAELDIEWISCEVWPTHYVYVIHTCTMSSGWNAEYIFPDNFKSYRQAEEFMISREQSA